MKRVLVYKRKKGKRTTLVNLACLIIGGFIGALTICLCIAGKDDRK